MKAVTKRDLIVYTNHTRILEEKSVMKAVIIFVVGDFIERDFHELWMVGDGHYPIC